MPSLKYNKQYKSTLIKMLHVEMFHSFCIFKGAMKIRKYEHAQYEHHPSCHCSKYKRFLIHPLQHSCELRVLYYFI